MRITFASSCILTLTIVIGLWGCTGSHSENGSMEEEFHNPSTENRPLAFWPWLNGYVDSSKMVYELKEMKDKGMRGALIWDVGALADPQKMIPAGPSFLGPESINYISTALRTASQLGLDLGLCTASSWNAGGSWTSAADASKQLLGTNRIVTGPLNQTIEIAIPQDGVGKGRTSELITSLAFPYRPDSTIDLVNDRIVMLDSFTSPDKKYIHWRVPAGKWNVVSFFMCNTGQKLECPSPNSNGWVIDHLSGVATRNHFDTILNRLTKATTAEHALKFLEVDSYELMEANDWTPDFLHVFAKRYGYEPWHLLPLLQGFRSRDSIAGARILADYHRLVSDLIIENHFSLAGRISGSQNIRLLAEAGHGGSARVDPLKALGHSTIPMGEFWNRERFWVTKEAASAAHIYGKKIVAAESLTGWQSWQQGPRDFKQLIDIAFCEGLNQVVFHTFAHNPAIAGKPGFAYHAGEHFNVNTTWWSMVRPFMDYISRCSYLLRQGDFVADLCLYYGDQAPNLVPPRRIDPNIKPIYGDNQCLHCGQPKPVNPGNLPGYDYDYMNAEIITDRLTAKSGNLVLPSGQSYRLMVLPDREDVSLEVLKKLDTLVGAGAILIGPKPRRSTSFYGYPDCDRKVQQIAERLWGNCDGKIIQSVAYGKGKIYWGKTVKQVLNELGIPPDMEVTGTDNTDEHIDYIHRQTPSQEIYFLSNSKPEQQKITCTFRVDREMVPEIWDAETGFIQRKVVYSKAPNGLSIELELDPLASRFVVFQKNTSANNDSDLNDDLQFGFNHGQNENDVRNSIDISHNWTIQFDTAMGGPESFKMYSLVSWTDINQEGARYYSGAATYEKDFELRPDDIKKAVNAFVVFDDIREMARVSVNGNDCGIVWTPPFKATVTPYLLAGVNHLKVTVINTWNNRIVGDVKNPGKRQYTNTNIKYKFKPDHPLLRSGLMGKVKLVLLNRVP